MARRRWGVVLDTGPGSRWGYLHCRVIRTARTEKAINAAVDEGFFPLVKKVEPSPDVFHSVFLVQDPGTGKVRAMADLRVLESGLRLMVAGSRYPYHFPSPFAAYLLPPDLVPGETVWLDDLIEDVVAIRGNQGYFPRLASAPAVWNGTDFELAFDPVRDAEYWYG